MPIRRGFTIVELLVVISIIVLLIAIMNPALAKAKENTRAVRCLSNLRQLGIASISFTNDHAQRMPGIWSSVWVNRNIPGGGCWLSNPPAGQPYFDHARSTGELYSYIGRDDNVYRCPSLPAAPLYAGQGSNDKFDYSAFHAFAGARMQNMPGFTVVVAKDNLTVRTPWLIEESPDFYLNTSNPEGGFGGGDIIGSWHNGNNHISSIDGSATAIKNALGLSSYHFYAHTPRRIWTNLASHGSGWGGWDGR